MQPEFPTTASPFGHCRFTSKSPIVPEGHPHLSPGIYSRAARSTRLHRFWSIPADDAALQAAHHARAWSRRVTAAWRAHAVTRIRRLRMANLFAITYPDPNRAEQAMKSIEWSNLDHLINVKAACRISKENGEYKVHPSGHPGAGRAAAGGALGLLVGSLFAIPVVGLAAGAAVGLHRGRQKAEHLDDSFVKSIGDQLESGGSAIV